MYEVIYLIITQWKVDLIQMALYFDHGYHSLLDGDWASKTFQNHVHIIFKKLFREIID